MPACQTAHVTSAFCCLCSCKSYFKRLIALDIEGRTTAPQRILIGDVLWHVHFFIRMMFSSNTHQWVHRLVKSTETWFGFLPDLQQFI